jgi:hypothetical protein
MLFILKMYTTLFLFRSSSGFRGLNLMSNKLNIITIFQMRHWYYKIWCNVWMPKTHFLIQVVLFVVKYINLLWKLLYLTSPMKDVQWSHRGFTEIRWMSMNMNINCILNLARPVESMLALLGSHIVCELNRSRIIFTKIPVYFLYSLRPELNDAATVQICFCNKVLTYYKTLQVSLEFRNWNRYLSPSPTSGPSAVAPPSAGVGAEHEEAADAGVAPAKAPGRGESHIARERHRTEAPRPHVARHGDPHREAWSFAVLAMERDAPQGPSLFPARPSHSSLCF